MAKAKVGRRRLWWGKWLGFLKQRIGDEAGWRRVELRVLLNLSLYLFILPPEGKVLVGQEFVRVYEPSLDDSVFLSCVVEVDDRS